MIFKAIDRFLQNVTGIPFDRMHELLDFYNMINEKIRPIIEQKLREKTGIQDLKNVKSRFELIRFDLFEPPKWSDAKTEKAQIEYALKTMEMLSTCLQTFNIGEKEGVNIQILRKTKREMEEWLNQLT